MDSIVIGLTLGISLIQRYHHTLLIGVNNYKIEILTPL